MSRKSSNLPPSSNWLMLQKTLSKKTGALSKHTAGEHVPRKRRKLEHQSVSPASTVHPSDDSHTHGTSFDNPAYARGRPLEQVGGDAAIDSVKDGEPLVQLRRIVLGEIRHTESHKQPGKYLALDCEMVGVGIDGSESALARVSIVNYYGHTLLDVFVRPRERVVDYRTEFSGIRPSDMIHARPFEEVQKEVADLLKDRILVGHAVHNDLKALLLSHPRPQTRDTQILAHKHGVSRGRRPALRHLVKQELGLTIQGGEHSSVTDARATMALFRLHRRTWEKNMRPMSRLRSKSPASSPPPSRKRSRAASAEDDNSGGEDDPQEVTAALSKTRDKSRSKTKVQEAFPGGGRRGISSGLSTIVKRPGKSREETHAHDVKSKRETKEKWWKELGGGGGSGSKGSLRLKV